MTICGQPLLRKETSMENTDLDTRLYELESLVDTLDDEILSLQKKLELAISQIPKTCALCSNGPVQCEDYEQCRCGDESV